MNNFRTVKDAARELGVTDRTIHKRIEAGHMQAERIGQRMWLIPESEIERWREIGRMKPGPKPQPKEPATKRPPGRPRKAPAS